MIRKRHEFRISHGVAFDAEGCILGDRVRQAAKA